MKKLTFIFMMSLCLSFTACNNDDNTESFTINTESRQTVSRNLSYGVYKVKVDNHDYIVARTIAGYGDGISIIHSESCECKKIK